MEELVADIERSFAELERQLEDPALYDDPKAAAALTRRHKHLKVAADLAARWRELQAEIAEALELAGDDEAEIRELARTQRAAAEEELPELEERIRFAMVEPDEADERDVIVEIRQGAGGDEAAIWAGDLYEMYTRFAARRGMRPELIDASPSDAGGFSEVTFALKGGGAWSQMKYERGVHRVQRVPKTESQGRIHTSTASVVVRPEADPVDVHLDMNDVKVDVYRSSGPGGQSVNTTDSAVRLTHLPTGTVVTCQNEKSQLQNKEAAMRVLLARLYEIEREKAEAELSADRRSAIGTGDRAEKIRTYNYGESRVTDHRIKLTLHKLDAVLKGELDDFVDALQADEQRRRLEEQMSGSGSVA
jgi:peptide chain release factor 1